MQLNLLGELFFYYYYSLKVRTVRHSVSLFAVTLFTLE